VTKPYTLNDPNIPHDPNHPFLVTLNGYGLDGGKHGPEKEGSFCLLECASVARGLAKTDDPSKAGLPDFRPWNDAYPKESSADRTFHGARIAVVLWDWPSWSEDRKQAFYKSLALQVIQQILPILLRAAGLKDHAKACGEAKDLKDARAAADAAAYSAASAAAYSAARAAARAAKAAARAAAYSAARAAAYAAADAAADAAAHAANAANAAANAAERTKVLNLFADLVVAAALETVP
jgi:hypothetical protein